MTRTGAGALALVAVLTLGACGTTYVDSSVTIPVTGPTTTSTLPPVDPDASLDELFTDLDATMRHLDERIIDRDHPAETLARLEELWAITEGRIRDDDPDKLFPFEQAMELVRSGVDRNRAADASKAYKLLVAAVTAYD